MENGEVYIYGMHISPYEKGNIYNILPLGFVFLLYWLFKKKNVNTMKLILLVIALSVALSFLGIM